MTENGRKPIANDPFVDEFRTWVETESHHRRFWIARIDGAAVGMVNLLVFDRMPAPGGASGGWGYLCNMYIDAAHRNAGLGADLAAALLSHADEIGLERVVLKPSERSRPFYGSLGFNHADDMLLVRQHPG